MIDAEILLDALENYKEFPEFWCPYCEQSFCALDNTVKKEFNTENLNNSLLKYVNQPI